MRVYETKYDKLFKTRNEIINYQRLIFTFYKVTKVKRQEQHFIYNLDQRTKLRTSGLQRGRCISHGRVRSYAKKRQSKQGRNV